METSSVDFDDVVKMLERIEADAKILLAKSFNQVASVAEDENIAQLQAGQRSDGSSLPNYSFSSVHRFGKPPGAIRLYDQGDFYRGIKMSANEEGVTMEGTDLKTQMLELRYGTKIVGLSESSLQSLENDYIVEILIENVRQDMAQ